MAIEHVVVLALENRSFDHMLGFLDHPDPKFEGLSRGGPYENPGADKDGPPVAATAVAKNVLPFGPDHSHDAVMDQLGVSGHGANRTMTNQGFVASYERKARGLGQGGFGGLLAPLRRLFGRTHGPVAEGRGPLVMMCQSPANVPVLSKLALEFAVCDHWFCSVPGETWPNRNYLHAATSDGETDIDLRPYTDQTIFELLEKHHKRWRIYHDDTPQVWAFPKLWNTPQRHGNWFPASKFAVHAAAGDLAEYSFIEPNHRPPFHTVDMDQNSPGLSTSQHPDNNVIANDAYDSYDGSGTSDFKRAEALIASIYEALRANPDLFNRTLFVITYDEHGGLYDHVPPPTGVPTPGDSKSLVAKVMHAMLHRRTRPFDFTMLGPRVPAVIVSPTIPAGTLDVRTHDHASVPSTLRAIFAPDAEPLTARDAWSLPFHDLATLDEPRTDLPDLSDFIPTTAGALPPTVTDTTTVTGRVPTEVPDYYQDFIKQADQVRQELEKVAEPEVDSLVAGKSDGQLGADVTLAFAKAAHRHRHNPATAPTDAGSNALTSVGE
jgi:phospholipase C